MAATLRAVNGSKKKAPAKKKAASPRSVSSAAKGGSQRELLEAMRDRIAKTLDSPETPPRDLASLSKRLIEITKELESFRSAEEKEMDDDGEVSDDEAWEGI
mgnify:FL=1|jgi:hypothetical protein